MGEGKHPLVGNVIVDVRPMTEREAKHCGFGYPFGVNGAPIVLVTRPAELTENDTFKPVVVPSCDPEGNGPGCLWCIVPTDAVTDDSQVVRV
jgi:hypothetical protein